MRFFRSACGAGEHTGYINDAELRSAPDTTLWRRPSLALVGAVFVLIDRRATLRQVYPIAELGKPLDEPTRAPAFMRLLVAPDQPRIEGENLDLRDEVLGQIFDKGDPVPKCTLIFQIEVTDEGTTLIGLGSLKRTFRNWRRIGKLTFDNAVASYNGDFVIHFNHPGWRYDRNNPAGAGSGSQVLQRGAARAGRSAIEWLRGLTKSSDRYGVFRAKLA